MAIAVSDDMIADLWCEEQPAQAVLVAITAAGLDDPIYVTDYDGTIDGKAYGGIVSGGTEYVYVPFTLSLVGASQTEVAIAAQLTIAGYDAALERAVQEVTGQPSIDISLVRVVAPDTVEVAVNGSKITSIELDDPQATATITPRTFATEPACAASAIHARTPALY